MHLFSHVRTRGRQVALLFLLMVIGISVAVVMDRSQVTSAGTMQAMPQVSLSPASGSAGSGLRIDGSGFAPYKRGELRWQRGGTTVSLQRFTADARGAFSVPTAAPPVGGLYTVSYSSRGLTASAWFTVAADGGEGRPTVPPTQTPESTPTTSATATPTTSNPAPTQSATPGPGSSRVRNVVGYLPIWARNAGYRPSDIDFTAVNTVAHFAVVPRTDGTIEIPDWGPFPDTELVSVAHGAGARVVLVVGGDHYAATNGFASMAATASTRAIFINQLTNLVATYGYDGVDLDWEFPSSAGDRANLTSLISELRTALPTGKTLSMAAPANDWYGRYVDVAAVVPHLDWLGAMTYTFAASSWSPTASHNSALYGANSLDSSKTYYLGRGVPQSKLLLGIPFYGERFDGAGGLGDTLSTTQGGAVPYPDILGLASNGWTYNRDAAAGVPFLLRNDGAGVVTYDDAWSIGLKCDYVKSQALGGAIVWSLAQDRTSGGQPLLTAVRSCR